MHSISPTGASFFMTTKIAFIFQSTIYFVSQTQDPTHCIKINIAESLHVWVIDF